MMSDILLSLHHLIIHLFINFKEGARETLLEFLGLERPSKSLEDPISEAVLVVLETI
jgi:hypothetical protein